MGAAGVLVILLNVWLIPRRQGFRRAYAQRGIFIGIGMVIASFVMAAG